MGKIIDKIAGYALLFIANYVFSVYLVNNFLLALPLALVLTLCVSRAVSKPVRSMHARRSVLRRAEAVADEWAARGGREARAACETLVRKAFPADVDARILLLARHASRPIEVDDVLRAHRLGGTKLVLASTARATNAALAYARAQKNPRVRVIDRGELIALIAKHAPPTASQAPKTRKKWRYARILDQMRPAKTLFLACVTLMLFAVTRVWSYLAVALALSVLVCMRYARPRASDRLFPEGKQS